MNKSIKRGLTLMVMLACLCMTSVAMAGLVALHQGIADPTSEGWRPNGFGNSGLLEYTVSDAWVIDDKGTAFGSSKRYYHNLSSEEQADALSGWTLSTRLQVRDGDDTAPPLTGDSLDKYRLNNMAVMVEYISASKAYRMDFGLDADGNQIVLLQDGWAGDRSTGVAYTVTDGDYHTYSLVWQGDAASLFIDGTEVITGYTGRNETRNLNRVAWGAFFDASMGGANYNMVSFEVANPAPVPVPASVLLLAGGLVAASIARKKLIK